MGRKYTATVEAVSVSVAQDIFQVSPATGKHVRVLRISWKNTDQTLVTPQMVALRARTLPATVSAGSGGTTPSWGKSDQGDASCSATVAANNTTKATTSGTAVVQFEGSEHVYSGLDYTFRNPPIVVSGEAFVFELLNAPPSAIHASSQIDIEEIGG